MCYMHIFRYVYLAQSVENISNRRADPKAHSKLRGEVKQQREHKRDEQNNATQRRWDENNKCWYFTLPDTREHFQRRHWKWRCICCLFSCCCTIELLSAMRERERESSSIVFCCSIGHSTASHMNVSVRMFVCGWMDSRINTGIYDIAVFGRFCVNVVRLVATAAVFFPPVNAGPVDLI